MRCGQPGELVRDSLGQPLSGTDQNFRLPERKQACSPNYPVCTNTFRHSEPPFSLTVAGTPYRNLSSGYQPRAKFTGRPFTEQLGLLWELSSARAVYVTVVFHSFPDLRVFKTPFRAWGVSQLARQKSTSRERRRKSQILVFLAAFEARGRWHDLSSCQSDEATQIWNWKPVTGTRGDHACSPVSGVVMATGALSEAGVQPCWWWWCAGAFRNLPWASSAGRSGNTPLS